MQATVGDVMAALETLAPPSLAEAWDNVGLLGGHPEWPVEAVLVALDVTPQVVCEAVRLRCQMIVAHHPILFQPLKTLREDKPDGALAAQIVRAGLSVYAAHTNLDRVAGGLNDALAQKLELQDIQGTDFLRVGTWQGGDCDALLAHVRQTLNAPDAHLYGDGSNPAHIVATACGSGSDFAKEAMDAGAQVLITGDVRHHGALDALAMGLSVIDGGHVPTERMAVDILRDGLQNSPFGVRYSLRIECSQVDVYRVRHREGAS